MLPVTRMDGPDRDAMLDTMRIAAANLVAAILNHSRGHAATQRRPRDRFEAERRGVVAASAAKTRSSPVSRRSVVILPRAISSSARLLAARVTDLQFADNEVSARRGRRSSSGPRRERLQWTDRLSDAGTTCIRFQHCERFELSERCLVRLREIHPVLRRGARPSPQSEPTGRAT